jgi:protein arginine N-methyltransferase 1
MAVRPGSVVVDIGTGPGVFAVLACQLGASRVFAIESGPIIQVAREVAAMNDCAGKIEFIEGISTKADLPVRADVIVSDLRGILPFFGQHIPSIVDARQRFLAPGGVLIPRRDSVWAAVVEAPEAYQKIVGAWESNPLKQDLTPARRRVVNDVSKHRATPGQLLAKPQLWTVLDYAAIEDPDPQGRLDWTIERAGIGHGLLVWFDADLAEGIGFSNAPGAPETIYGSLLFPWTRPVSLAPGQVVCADIHAKLTEDDYVWRWTTRIQPADGANDSAVCFEQSQLLGAVLSAATLRRQASDYVPHLSADGLLQRRTLELMDGAIPLEEIARRLAVEFPGRFAQWQQALSYAGGVSEKFSG